jgi:hypothetical protein
MKNYSRLFVGPACLIALFLTGCLGGYQELSYNQANPYGYSPPPNMPPGYTAPPTTTAGGTNYGQAWDDSGASGQRTGTATQGAPTQTQTQTQADQTQAGANTTPPASESTARDYPSAAPVPGKPGFVTSPYSEDGAQIDVRGYPSGTPVKDPYTGGIFIVP